VGGGHGGGNGGDNSGGGIGGDTASVTSLSTLEARKGRLSTAACTHMARGRTTLHSCLHDGVHLTGFCYRPVVVGGGGGG